MKYIKMFESFINENEGNANKDAYEAFMKSLNNLKLSQVASNPKKFGNDLIMALEYINLMENPEHPIRLDSKMAFENFAAEQIFKNSSIASVKLKLDGDQPEDTPIKDAKIVEISLSSGVETLTMSEFLGAVVYAIKNNGAKMYVEDVTKTPKLQNAWAATANAITGGDQNFVNGAKVAIGNKVPQEKTANPE